MFAAFYALLGLSSALAGVSALPGEMGRRASSSSEFSIFAYGTSSDTDIGGYPIFYYDSYAYIANPAKLNYTQDYVNFTKDTNDTTTWIAMPLTVSVAPWEEALFYIPIGTGPVGFYKEGVSNVSSDDIITSGFRTYGTTVLITIDGTIYDEWYAVPTGVDGLWSVGWNATSSITDAEVISLSQGKPVNVDYP